MYVVKSGDMAPHIDRKTELAAKELAEYIVYVSAR